jgi:transposase
VAHTVRKTYKEKLRPTPEQEQAMDVVVWRCRTLYNIALEQRKTAWERCHVWREALRPRSGVEEHP